MVEFIDILYQDCFSYFKYFLLFSFCISVFRVLFKFVVRPFALSSSLDSHDDNKNDLSKNDLSKNDVYTKYYAHYDDNCL